MPKGIILEPRRILYKSEINHPKFNHNTYQPVYPEEIPSPAREHFLVGRNIGTTKKPLHLITKILECRKNTYLILPVALEEVFTTVTLTSMIPRKIHHTLAAIHEMRKMILPVLIPKIQCTPRILHIQKRQSLLMKRTQLIQLEMNLSQGKVDGVQRSQAFQKIQQLGI